MQRRALYRSPWFLHGPTLVVCTLVVAVAAVMSTTPQVVSIFGWEIPELCSWRRWFGIECFGCGMTRSFVFMAHGDIVSAFQMNKLGPVLFSGVAIQIPYRPYVLWRSLSARSAQLRDAAGR